MFYVIFFFEGLQGVKMNQRGSHLYSDELAEAPCRAELFAVAVHHIRMPLRHAASRPPRLLPEI